MYWQDKLFPGIRTCSDAGDQLEVLDPSRTKEVFSVSRRTFPSFDTLLEGFIGISSGFDLAAWKISALGLFQMGGEG